MDFYFFKIFLFSGTIKFPPCRIFHSQTAMGNKKKKLLEKYLEKKERQKERDSLVERLKELQKKTERITTTISTSQLTRKTKPAEKERRPREKRISTAEEAENKKQRIKPLQEEAPNDGIVWNKVEKREIIKEEKEEKKKPSVEKAQMIKTSKNLSKIRTVSVNLPITHMEDEIVTAVKENHITIITGGTGSGKSTQVPQFLYENGLTEHKKICITQPRRVSTQAVCRRIAEEQKSAVGSICGYKMRYDSRVSENTEIVVVTEGVLLQEMADDPFLSEYSVVILDEVHERSLCQDTILLVLAKIAVKSTLRLVLMSASITDEYVESIERISGIKVKRVEIEPLQYNVEIHYLQLRQYNYLEEMKRRIASLEEEEGSILGFVSTKEETEKMKSDLESIISKKIVYALHSDTSEEIQQSILRSKNAIVIATNVAETSLTLPDVNYVVDGGREIVKKYSYKENAYTFETCLVSKESTEQRKGRTGRVGPGICYRIFTTVEYEKMQENREPEIKRERVLPMVSALIKAGVTPGKIDRIQCITAPPPESVQKEIEELKRLSILDSASAMTQFGKNVLSLPIDPVLGSALLRAHSKSDKYLQYMIDIIARIELYNSRRVSYAPSYVQDTNTYIEVLCRESVGNTQRKRLIEHIEKGVRKILPDAKIDILERPEIDPENKEGFIACGKILAWSLAKNMVTFYNEKYYHNGQEVKVRTPLPRISADKPIPIMYYSLVYPDTEDTSKVALIGAVIPEY